MGAVTPETCRVFLQQINIFVLLHLVGFLLILNYDARNPELKKTKLAVFELWHYWIQWEMLPILRDALGLQVSKSVRTGCSFR